MRDEQNSPSRNDRSGTLQLLGGGIVTLAGIVACIFRWANSDASYGSLIAALAVIAVVSSFTLLAWFALPDAPLSEQQKRPTPYTPVAVSNHQAA